MTTGYLPADALKFVSKLYRQYRAYSLLAGLLLWAIITLVLRQRFHRGGMDVAVFALLLTLTLGFISACLYLLVTQSGYHFL